MANVQVVTVDLQVEAGQVRAATQQIGQLNRAIGATEQEVADVNREFGRELGIIEKLQREARQLQQSMERATNEQDVRRYNRELQQTRSRMQALQGETRRQGNQLKKLAKLAAGAFAVGRVVSFGKAAVDAFDQQAKAEQKVAQAIKSTAGAAGLSLKELKREASELQSKTLFGDEEILNKSTAQLLTFTNIADDNFKRTQQVALDLATVLDGDLQGASIQLGKALNDPVANLSALSRSGIQFSEDQKKVIKSLTETGRLGEAQGVILEELERQYGGQAEAAVAGAGSIQQLNNKMGDIKETIGGFIVTGLGPLVKGLGDLIAPTQKESDLLREQQVEVNVLTGILLDETAAQESKAEALRQLNELQPELVEGINAEAVNTEVLTKRLAAANQEYSKKIKLALAQEKVNALLEQQKDFVKGAVQAEIDINKAFAARFGTTAQLNTSVEEQIKKLKELGFQGLKLETQFGFVQQRQEALKRASDLLTAAQGNLVDVQAEAGVVAENLANKENDANKKRGDSVKSLKTELKGLKEAFEKAESADERKALGARIKATQKRIKGFEGLAKAAKTASEDLQQFVLIAGKLRRKDLVDDEALSFSFKLDDAEAAGDQSDAILEQIYGPGNDSLEIDASVTEIDMAPIDHIMERINALRAQAEEDGGLLKQLIGDPQEFTTSFLETAQAITGIISQFVEANTNKQLNELDREKQIKIEAAGEDAAARERIEAEFQTKREEIERQAAIKRKRIAITEAVIQTALNVIKTLANPFQAALVAAAGAANIAVIASQKFATGVFDLQGPGSGTSDSIPALLSRGESVIPAKNTKNHPEAVRAMVEGRFDKWLSANMALRPGLVEVTYGGNGDLGGKIEKLEKSLTKAISRLPVSVTQLDSRGYRQFVAGATTWKYHTTTTRNG